MSLLFAFVIAVFTTIRLGHRLAGWLGLITLYVGHVGGRMILGINEQVGTLEAGKRADLVAWKADPLANAAVFADREQIAFVVQAGRIVYQG